MFKQMDKAKKKERKKARKSLRIERNRVECRTHHYITYIHVCMFLKRSVSHPYYKCEHGLSFPLPWPFATVGCLYRTNSFTLSIYLSIALFYFLSSFCPTNAHRITHERAVCTRVKTHYTLTHNLF